MTSPETLFFLRLWTAAHKGERLVARELEAAGLQGRQLAMLLLVGELGPATTTALAAALGVPFMTASDALQRLVADGDLVQAPNPADRRSHVYALAPAGEARGGGSVWLGLESGTHVARVDPASARVRLVEAGDGASGFASDGSRVWIVAHRTNTLTRVDPTDGRVVSRSEIGPSGIEVLASGRKLVVSVATPRGARRGDPLLGALRTVDATTGGVTASVAASSSHYASGLALRGREAWTVDTVTGRAAHLPIG